MSTEDNKALVRRFFEEVLNQGNVAVVDELLAPGHVGHHSLAPNQPPSRELYKQYIVRTRTAFPDYHFTVELQVAEGDLVVTRGTARGTHTGEYEGLIYKGIPPTGKQVTWTETWIFRLADGKFVEFWSNEDDVGRLRQIGALPTPSQTS